MTAPRTTSEPKSGRLTDVFVSLLYLAGLVLAGYLFWEGGLEALVGALIGAIVGLRNSRGQKSRLGTVITASFTGFWAGTIVGGLIFGLHVALGLGGGG